ncbi:MAG: glycoside hydrolase family 3 C-terminal domain-containing protein, partial [Bacteroidales bacterium]|nr:glycoside hydrolase family 3 C-terminal domain-containing protein [Candidatus Hennigimonas equi]
ACGILDSKYVLESTGGMDLSGVTEEQIEALAQRYAVSANDIRNMARQFNIMKENFYPDPDIPALLEKLSDVDVVVFAGGISPRLEGEEMPVKCPGFASGDRTDIELPDVQRRVLKALHESGKKVVLVNFSGSAIGLVPETETCDAILQAWYPGQEGGTAIAEILYGDVNPSGKLPVTFYRSIEQLPDFEDYNMEGHTYRYFRGNPLYPFGYGLSYTSFEYGKASVRNGELTFRLKNTGKTDGTEIVQLYVSRPDDRKGPVKTLRAFRRVDVPAGKSVTVRIPLSDETFEWWNESNGRMEVRHGDYILHYGASSSDLETVNYTFGRN